MKPDIYTKIVLTVIALMLTVIACKPLVSPETTASAQSTAPFAGVQYPMTASFSIPAREKFGFTTWTPAFPSAYNAV